MINKIYKFQPTQYISIQQYLNIQVNFLLKIQLFIFLKLTGNTYPSAGLWPVWGNSLGTRTRTSSRWWSSAPGYALPLGSTSAARSSWSRGSRRCPGSPVPLSRLALFVLFGEFRLVLINLLCIKFCDTYKINTVYKSVFQNVIKIENGEKII